MVLVGGSDGPLEPLHVDDSVQSARFKAALAPGDRAL